MQKRKGHHAKMTKDELGEFVRQKHDFSVFIWELKDIYEYQGGLQELHNDVNLVNLELDLPQFCVLYICGFGRPKRKMHKFQTPEAKQWQSLCEHQRYHYRLPRTSIVHTHCHWPAGSPSGHEEAARARGFLDPILSLPFASDTCFSPR